MIVSHQHRFIFLHSRKVAGSSIQAYLNPFLGPRDLQIGAWQESIAMGGRYNRRAILETLSPKGLDVLLREWKIARRKGRPLTFSRVVNTTLKRKYGKATGTASGHQLAEKVASFMPDAWNSYFRFCFVRNPYERAVSDYKWRTKGSGIISFSEYLERLADPTRPDPEKVLPNPPTNWTVYTINDQIAVDFVGRFENLHDDMQKVCETLGLPFDSQRFPRAKQSRPDGRNYRDWYADRERELADRIFRNELDAFGYSF